MSKIAILKDTHFRLGFPAPIARKDNYEDTIYNKINFVISECKKREINILLITGDVFDKKYLRNYSSISMKKNIELLQHIKNTGINVVSIAGNHDLPYNNYNNVGDSIYGMVSDLGLIKDISNDKIQIENNIIYGIPFTENPDEMFEKLDFINKERCKGNKYVVLHEHFIPFDGEIDDLKFSKFFRYTELMEFKNIQGFILGHLHRGFPVEKYTYDDNTKQIFINSWSFFRLNRGYYTSMGLHTPEVTFLNLDNMEAEVLTVPYQPYKEVFINNETEVEDDGTVVTNLFDNLFNQSMVKINDSLQQLVDNCPEEIKEMLIYYIENKN